MEHIIESIGFMLSKDFKKRMTAEYRQLALRCKKLEEMCRKYEAGELSFTPNCSLTLLRAQLEAMKTYKGCLEERAEVEGIDLSDEEDTSTWSVTFRENEDDAMQMTANGYNTEILDNFCNAIVTIIRENLRENVTAEKVSTVIGDAVKSIFEKMQEAEGKETEEGAEPEGEETATEGEEQTEENNG